MHIEIHGVCSPEAEIVRASVFATFVRESFCEDMVVSIHRHDIRDFQHNSQPFFRVYTSGNSGEEKSVIPALLKFGWDVQHVKLEAFYPKE